MPDDSAPNTKYLRPASVDLAIVAVAGGDDVECQRHQLEPEIEHDQVAGRDQHHHAKRREQYQDRKFKNPPRRIGQEFRRQDQGGARAISART